MTSIPFWRAMLESLEAIPSLYSVKEGKILFFAFPLIHSIYSIANMNVVTFNINGLVRTVAPNPEHIEQKGLEILFSIDCRCFCGTVLSGVQ